MHWLRAILVAAVVVSSPAMAVETDERFPYSAFAVADGTPVRSGPSEAFYPVLTLRSADAVEVWRHDPGGWCAIRPPEGSFSWVSAEFVERRANRLGIIAGSQVNVRVGTQFSDLRDAIQLQLSDGDEVEILETRTLATGNRETQWFKISPPAGEFRWVHERHLTRQPLPATTNETPDDPFAGNPAATGNIRAAAFVDAGTPSATIDVLTKLRDLPADAPAETVLGEMELVVSRMIVAEPTAWNFAELKLRAETLHEQTQSAVDRSQIRLFLAKLARLEDIQRRYGSIARHREQTTAVDRELVQPAAYNEVTAAAETESTPQPMPRPQARTTATVFAAPNINVARYDGTGRLTPVVARDGQGASYALTDDRGEVTAYVTAAPGVNLRQFAGLDVGINGIRGQSPAGEPQIAAKRIDVLAGANLR